MADIDTPRCHRCDRPIAPDGCTVVAELVALLDGSSRNRAKYHAAAKECARWGAELQAMAVRR